MSKNSPQEGCGVSSRHSVCDLPQLVPVWPLALLIQHYLIVAPAQTKFQTQNWIDSNHKSC